MAAKMINGKVNDSYQDFVRTAKVGTETITASVGAGEIAIVIDTGVDLSDSNEIHTTVRDMLNFFMEKEFVET